MFTVYVFFLFGTTLLFLQKAIQIAWDSRLLKRPLGSMPLFGLSCFTFLYSATIFASLHLHGQRMSYTIFCLFPILGSLKQRSYATTLATHLGLDPRALRLPRLVFTALAAAFAAGWALWTLFGLEVVLTTSPHPHPTPMLIAMGLDGFTPTPFTLLTTVVFLGFTIFGQLKILGYLRRGKQERDPFLIFGIFLTLGALINEMLGGTGTVSTYSFMFLAEGIETFRLSAILRRQAQLRIDSLEQDINAMAPMAHLGLFVGAIAHDIRNPLAIVSTSASLLERASSAPVDPKVMAKFLGAIREATGRMDGIVRRYLALARSNEAVDTRSVALRPIIAEAITLSARKLRAAGDPKIEIQMDDSLEIPGNAMLLEMLFMNLIVNSAEALRGVENARILIRGERRGTECVLEIEDNGSGIAPEHQQKLFRQVWTSKPEEQGTGLGLRIVDQIVQRHRGRIRLKESTGMATCFEILLPLA